MGETNPKKYVRGFTLVEMLITAAVMALVFGGLMLSVRATLVLISNSKATTSAVTLATERLEYIRSLSYDSIGTVGGIPNGLIKQNSTTSLNGVPYHERVLIEYIDSADDGVGGADANGILADYKQVKVEYSWMGKEGTSTISLITNVVPNGIESTAGGGTLTVNVFDANALPVSAAQVRVYNNTTTSTIDVTKSTNASGVALFSGAPEAANYQITVTKAGYSTDQTYTATTSNPNPITSHVAVLAGTVSTMNFQIDQLSDVLVRTIGPSTDGEFEDLFQDSSKVATRTNAVLLSDEAVLDGGAGAYAPVGSVLSVSTTPSVITTWDTVSWTSRILASTTVTVQVCSVTGTSTCTIIPDADLPGNAAGFSTGPIDISGLSVSTYPSLALLGTLTSTNVNVTPQLNDWRIDYIITEPSIGNVPFTLTGSKSVGTDSGLVPIPKHVISDTTDAGGTVQLTDLEWDAYALVLNTSAYDISDTCPNLPLNVSPNTSETVRLTLVPSVANSLRVSVVDINGVPLVGADVQVTRGGFNQTITTSTCGNAFFNSGLVSATDYTADVSKSGYIAQTITNVSIGAAGVLTVILLQ